jgi:DNA replication protein DnaC
VTGDRPGRDGAPGPQSGPAPPCGVPVHTVAGRAAKSIIATAQQWIDRLEQAQHRNALDAELRRLERYSLLVVDEIGYLPLERQAANLLFALVARRYERGSIIVTSNRGFEAWGEILGDAMVAAALIDRLIHHAHMVTLKGKSYRLRERTSRHPRPQTA